MVNATETVERIEFPEPQVLAAMESFVEQGWPDFRRSTQGDMASTDPGLQVFDFGLYRDIAARGSLEEAEAARTGFYLAYQVLRSARRATQLSPTVDAYLARSAINFDYLKMRSHHFQLCLIGVVEADYRSSPAINGVLIYSLSDNGAGRFGARLALGIYGRLAHPDRAPFRLPTKDAVQFAPRRQERRQQQAGNRKP